VGLAITAAAGFLAGTMAFQALDLSGANEQLLCVAAFWLIGLVLTIKVSGRVARGG
jgi:hypothetical protein